MEGRVHEERKGLLILLVGWGKEPYRKKTPQGARDRDKEQLACANWLAGWQAGSRLLLLFLLLLLLTNRVVRCAGLRAGSERRRRWKGGPPRSRSRASRVARDTSAEKGRRSRVASSPWPSKALAVG